MSVLQLNPYLHFNGNAKEAIAFYERVFGAQVAELVHYGAEGGKPSDDAGVMHAMLRLGGGYLMISDMPPGMTGTPGSNMEVFVGFSSAEEVLRAYDALSAGGQALQPVHDTFFGGKLGMLVDRFGVRWITLYEDRMVQHYQGQKAN